MSGLRKNATSTELSYCDSGLREATFTRVHIISHVELICMGMVNYTIVVPSHGNQFAKNAKMRQMDTPYTILLWFLYYCGYAWECFTHWNCIHCCGFAREWSLYYCGYTWKWPLQLWLRMGMISSIVVTHGNGFYYCRHMGKVSTIVATHGNGPVYYCGYTWEWSLLLWLLMGMAQRTIVDAHGNSLYFCVYAWECPLLLWLRMGMASSIVDTWE